MPIAKESYYGAFFWLSVAAFVVPVFVGVQAFQAVPKPYTKPAPNPDASGVDHALWDYLLKTYVADGLVDYEGLKRDHLFKDYLRQLGAAQPDQLGTDAERLALLCNAYNALVINGVLTHKITDHVVPFDVDGTKFFDLEEHIFAGETVSLNHIEHKMIRATYNEPRIHVALVCAAQSCPVIRAEAYAGPDLERQLEDQARQFANDSKHVAYDAEANTLRLSAILLWYSADFGPDGGFLDFLLPRVEDAQLKEAIQKAKAREVKLAYNTYDWALNTQGEPAGAPRSGKSAEFGSGSIPNE